ncbi:MAG: hypothetical protein J1F03_00065 [Oscillospiraceae bacterium]|nr:hypothetical protein [Oscillospiraceae bacterium]
MSKPIISIDKNGNGSMQTIINGDSYDVIEALNAAVYGVIKCLSNTGVYKSKNFASQYGSTFLAILKANGFTPDEIRQIGTALIALAELPPVFPEKETPPSANE